MDYLDKYFPELDLSAKQLLHRYVAILSEKNQNINLISRKETDVELHHIVHSLAISKVVKFKPGAQVLDLGTGGGLPGIPLAIIFPEVSFTLVDSIGKKVTACKEMISELGLKNVRAVWARAEDLDERYDFIVTRAVAKVETLRVWTHKLLKNKHMHAIPNGILALKGGDLAEELASINKREYYITPLHPLFNDSFFDGKLIVYIQ